MVEVVACAVLLAGTAACHVGPASERSGAVAPAPPACTATGSSPHAKLPLGDTTQRKLAAWRRTDAQWAHWTDPSPHRVRMVAVSRGVRLEVLDWGGTGPAVVLLAGSGGAAHVYDDLAPQLTDAFHVLAITRRGHGVSSRADSATYTIDTSTTDIRAVLDTLGIGRVSLVGHSIAGAEITRFAARYPDRVEKLVYLDSAHDFTGYNELIAANPAWPLPVALPAQGTHEDTLDAWRRWGKRCAFGYWSDALEIDAVRSPNADTVALRLLLADAQRQPKEYRNVRAPALALASRYTAERWFFYLDPVRDSVKWRAAERWIDTGVRPFLAKGHQRFLREIPHGRLVEFDSDHFLFIYCETRTLAELRSFLGADRTR
jgi:non-heme chloroperoxidase